MKQVPTVSQYMTAMPKSIGFDQPISKAQGYMKEFNVRHLPVLKGGQLVGILSERDIHLILTFKDVDPKKVSVDEAYTPDPFFTSPDTPLKEVTIKMAQKKYGSAIVVDRGELVGIFTEIDAYKALADMC